MKIFCVLLFIFLVFPVFSEQTEIAFFLFMPNSSNRFINEGQARINLDNAARNLLARNLSQGQIHVGGYAADARNDIDPVELSRNRALFVIQELQNRGVPQYVFSSPTAYGSVDLWGNNLNERQRSQNRRVIILLDNTVLPPASPEPAPTPAPPTPEPVVQEPLPAPEPAAQESALVPGSEAAEETRVNFMSCIVCILLLILFFITLFFLIREIMFLSRRKIII